MTRSVVGTVLATVCVLVATSSVRAQISRYRQAVYAAPAWPKDPIAWDYKRLAQAFDVVQTIRDIERTIWRLSYGSLIKRFGKDKLPADLLDRLLRLHGINCTAKPGWNHRHRWWWHNWMHRAAKSPPQKMLRRVDLAAIEQFLPVMQRYARSTARKVERLLKHARKVPRYRTAHRLLIRYFDKLEALPAEHARAAAIAYQKLLTVMNVTDRVQATTGDRGAGVLLLRQLHNPTLRMLRDKLERKVDFGLVQTKKNQSGLSTYPGGSSDRDRRRHARKTCRLDRYGSTGHRYGAVDLSTTENSRIALRFRKQIRLAELPHVLDVVGAGHRAATASLVEARVGRFFPKSKNNRLTLVLRYQASGYDVVFMVHLLHMNTIASQLNNGLKWSWNVSENVWTERLRRIADPTARLKVGTVGTRATKTPHLHLAVDFELCDRGKKARAVRQCKTGCRGCKLPRPVCKTGKRVVLAPASPFVVLADYK